MADTSAEVRETVEFSEINWKQQEEQDESQLADLMRNMAEGGNAADGLFQEREVDQADKADDAEDFGDISDDDLPDEEDASPPNAEDLPGLTEDAGTSNDTDDLFGEDRGSSPFRDFDDQDNVEPEHMETQPVAVAEDENAAAAAQAEDIMELNFPGYREMMANQDLSIPAPAESEGDLLAQWWPTFVKGGQLFLHELLPPKKAHFVPKAPPKQPKPLQATKVSLDLAPDQEKSFRTAGPATGDKRKREVEAEAKGLVAIIEESSDEEANEDGFDFEEPPSDEKLGGVTWADLQMICDDWDSKILSEPPVTDVEVVDDQPMDDWEREILGHSAKRKKITHKETDYLNAPRFAVPSFDDLDQATAISAKRPLLDMNDPHLLLEELKVNPVAKRQRISGNLRSGHGNLSKTLSKRFNISNDEAYDALKENHQSKVRAAINNVTIEHSLPALRLQWPYYKVKLYTREARSHHRPSLKFQKFLNQTILFTKAGGRKKKEARHLTIPELFKETKDLTLSDHYASATLVEYSEEQPIILSNFGMGNRIINYYRRKDADDTDRPIPEDRIGDTTILVPEDKSPFSNFGFVDPGETVRSIHNSMYRAPLYKHEPKNTDFLCIRSSTGVDGTQWHLRNIDNIFVAGQQLPFVEVPSPHSRKVTNAAKNRVKMIAFRKIRRNPHKYLRISELTAHIPETTDMQNRQKLKEILTYDKNDKVWRPMDGTTIPDPATLQALVKPEDVCMIDAMQVGVRHLADSGYAAASEKEEKDDVIDALPIEQQLTPWNTSKAFADATTGKAMLKLHGEGDPSGCGLAFSMIRTSMKGGYIGAVQGPNATSAAAMEAQKKANNGHTYNVKKQEELYNTAIRDIWEKQKSNLADVDEHLQNDLEDVDEDERFTVAPTPHSTATPAAMFDDSVSQVSRLSMDNPSGKFLRITRTVAVGNHGQTQEVQETVKDVRVWREYMKRRRQIDAAKSE